MDSNILADTDPNSQNVADPKDEINQPLAVQLKHIYLDSS